MENAGHMVSWSSGVSDHGFQPHQECFWCIAFHKNKHAKLVNNNAKFV